MIHADFAIQPSDPCP